MIHSNLTQWSKEIHEANKAKGFYDDEKNIGEMLALIHSEVSEALEAHRSGEFFVNHEDLKSPPDSQFRELFLFHIKDTFEDEVADILIRVLDLCGYLGIDIDFHVHAKLKYNATREYKHGKKY